MDDDWDLHAVVRGCARSAVATVPSNSNPLPKFPSLQNDHFPDNRRNLPHDPYQVGPPLPAAVRGGPRPIPAVQPFQPFQHIMQIQPPIPINVPTRESLQFRNPRIGIASPNFPVVNNPQPIRLRKRKNQQAKTVRQMTEEELAADAWAWRKYGQKPIKGSPHPRNYYRCSTSKGCAARKQVERSSGDPNIFLVSYAGEHTHPRPANRSSLAGSSRGKFATTAAAGPSMAVNNNNAYSVQTVEFSSSSSASLATEGDTAAVENEDVEMAEEEEEEDDDDDDDDEDAGGEELDEKTIPIPDNGDGDCSDG